MGSKKSDPVQWWDRGRERWRSRPEKKERSLDECVGGKRRPVRETFARRDPAVRVALRSYCDDRDEDALDDRLVRERASAPWWLRWRHSVRRRARIADQQQGVWGFLRKLSARSARWLPRECVQFAAYQAADWTARFAMQDELLALLHRIPEPLARHELMQRASTMTSRESAVRGCAIEAHARTPVSKRGPLSEHPRLVQWIPSRGARLKLAKRLLRQLWKWERNSAARVVPAALWPLVHTRRAENDEPEKKPMHQWIAIMFAEMFQWLPVGYAQQHWRRVRWSSGAAVLRVLDNDPELRAAVEKWTALNLADERVIASQLRARERWRRG